MNGVSPHLFKYILFFSVLYSIGLALINILQFGFGVDIGTGTNIGNLVGAGLGAAIKFVQDNHRPPNKKEKRLLSINCVIATLLISFLALTLAVNFTFTVDEVSQLKEIYNKLSLGIWLLIISFISLIDYVALLFVFGWGAKKFANKTVAQ